MDTFTRENNLKVFKEELNRSILEAKDLLTYIEKLEKLRESLRLDSSMKDILNSVNESLSFKIKISDEGLADKLLFLNLEDKQVYGKIYLTNKK